MNRPVKILITGPESSGKTTLAKALASRFAGAFVGEYAREYLSAREGRYVEDDLAAILRGQLRAERTAIDDGHQLIVCDTGPEVLYVWSEEQYSRVSLPIQRAVKEARYDLTLLCAPLPHWQPDPLREHPDPADRQRLFDRYRQLLGPAAVILPPGSEAERLHRACTCVRKLMP